MSEFGQDYYDPAPLVTLARPVALVGFLGAGTSITGHTLCASLGLGFSDLDRLVEHAAGMSCARLQLEHGENARRTEEARQLQAMVHRKPPGILVLGNGALLRGLNRALVLDTCELVYLARPLEVCFSRLLEERARAPERYPEFIAAAPTSPADLEPLFEARRTAYETAPHRIDAGDAHAADVAKRVADHFGWPL